MRHYVLGASQRQQLLKPLLMLGARPLDLRRSRPYQKKSSCRSTSRNDLNRLATLSHIEKRYSSSPQPILEPVMKQLKRMRLAWTAFFCSGIVGLAMAQTGDREDMQRFGLHSLGELVEVRSPRVSPDGKSIVVVVSRPDYEENVYVNQLVLVDIASGVQRVLTANRPDVSRPRWSPNGAQLAFLAKNLAGDDQQTQVFVLPMQGGESRVVTSAERGVGFFEWSADGDSIFYTAAKPVAEVPAGPQRHNKSFEVANHDYLATQRPSAIHVWRIAATGGAPQRINGNDVIVDSGHLGCLTVAGDGSAVAFRSFPSNRPGDQRRASLSVIDLASGVRRQFGSALDRISWGAFSPDGKGIACCRPENGVFAYASHSLYHAESQGGEAVKMSGGVDRSFWGAMWMPDGQSVIAAARDAARDSVWVQSLSGPARKLDLGELNVLTGFGPAELHVSPNGGVALIAGEAERPNELYWLDSVDATPRRLTHYNEEITALTLGRSEEFKWTGPDGFQENGILTYPPGFDSDRSYPLVLAIHGGPMSASTLRFDELTQLLAARGFVVFAPNYRGSDNLGARYQSSIVHDAGAGPGRDVIAGLAAVKQLGFVDNARVGVSGWSYGGYMTSWLIGNYPDVWRAAVAGAPVTDYVDQYALSDLNTLFGWAFDKNPWDPAGQAEWRAQSPIAHAHKVTAPTLILCNTGDLRVPITESYKLYRALDDQNVPVKFVAYPIPGHFPADPVHRRDVYRRWCEWMEQRFKLPRDAPAQ
jgi:dipeptidyl aminopeptidase/acylaminoacyl peptidase